ncbi:type II secretion system protein J [Kineosporia sp. R_H_3]|uniref:PulJ/GspJ family protein n=1 Tax=Kineosporia sp. R_H_3 TaxID=1961848 RepID=UPI000B4AE328|nr:hypothetical protein [Kineosporia sp. R_H_3]
MIRRLGRGPAGRSGRRREAGVSVVELAVTAAVGSVVLVGVATVAIGTMNASRSVAVRVGTSADTRVVGEAVSRSLRTAVRPKGQSAAVVQGTATSVTFYALLNRSGAAQSTDTVASLVELGWDGTCVTRRITPGVAVTSPATTGPFWTWTPSGTPVCLARTTTPPAYRYYATAVLAQGGVDTAPVALVSGALASTDLRGVQSIEVALTVTDPKHPEVPGAPLLTRVTLSNVLTDSGGV